MGEVECYRCGTPTTRSYLCCPPLFDGRLCDNCIQDIKHYIRTEGPRDPYEDA